MFEVYNNNGAKILSCNMELGKEGLQETEQVPMEYESDSLEQSTLLFEIDAEMVFSEKNEGSERTRSQQKIFLEKRTRCPNFHFHSEAFEPLYAQEVSPAANLRLYSRTVYAFRPAS